MNNKHIKELTIKRLSYSMNWKLMDNNHINNLYKLLKLKVDE